MRDYEPACYLSEDELERWRDISASITTAENTTVFDPDDWQRVRAFYYQSYLAKADFYDAHGLDKAREILINTATGSVMYEPIEVEVEME